MKPQLNPKKRQHGLGSATGHESFLAALANEGVDLDEVLSNCIRPGASAGVLLVGSLSERLGNEASDVDLLVLLDSRDDLRLAGEGLAMQSGRAMELLLYRNHIEINIELFVREDVERLMEAFISMAPALYDPAELKHLPLLQHYDLRFLHRLKCGWPLRGKRVVEQWRDEFMTDMLGTYLAVRYFSNYDELFEDAAIMLRSNELAAFHVARICVEQALLSALASVGFTGPDRKWLLYWCERAKDKPLAAFLQEGTSLLLMGSGQMPTRNYVEKVRTLGLRLLDHLRLDDDLRRATDFLRTRIGFVPLEQEIATAP